VAAGKEEAGVLSASPYPSIIHRPVRAGWRGESRAGRVRFVHAWSNASYESSASRGEGRRDGRLITVEIASAQKARLAMTGLSRRAKKGMAVEQIQAPPGPD